MYVLPVIIIALVVHVADGVLLDVLPFLMHR